MRVFSAGVSRRVVVAFILAVTGLIVIGLAGSAQAQGSCPIDENRLQNIVPLVSGEPVTGTVRGAPGEFVTVSLTQYTFEVPNYDALQAGQARLVIDLIDTISRDNDIDLLVRVGEPIDYYVGSDGDCHIHVDYFSATYSGVEQVVIDAQGGHPHGSGPPLQATTYYIAVTNLESSDQNYRLVANLTPPPPPTCERVGAIILDPNRPMKDQNIGIGASALTLDPKTQYCIAVSAETTLLALSVQGEGNLNLYVRLNKPVEKSGEQINADFLLISPSSTQTIILAGSQLNAGNYFLAVENLQTTSQKFTILAIPVWNIESLKQATVGGQIEPPLLAFLNHYLQTDHGMLSLTQYKVTVPQGVKRLKIRLSGPKDVNLDLHIRFGKPVQIEGGQVVADLSLVGPTSDESTILAGTLLQAGDYYLAVEGPQGPPQPFTLTVETEQANPTMALTEGNDSAPPVCSARQCTATH